MTESEQPEVYPRPTAYNGWPNYATWAAFSWLTSYEESYLTAQRVVHAAGDTFRGADQLKGWIEANNPLADEASLYSDILGWALQAINWDELARAFGPDEGPAGDSIPNVALL